MKYEVMKNKFVGKVATAIGAIPQRHMRTVYLNRISRLDKRRKASVHIVEVGNGRSLDDKNLFCRQISQELKSYRHMQSLFCARHVGVRRDISLHIHQKQSYSRNFGHLRSIF